MYNFFGLGYILFQWHFLQANSKRDYLVNHWGRYVGSYGPGKKSAVWTPSPLVS